MTRDERVPAMAVLVFQRHGELTWKANLVVGGEAHQVGDLLYGTLQEAVARFAVRLTNAMEKAEDD